MRLVGKRGQTYQQDQRHEFRARGQVARLPLERLAKLRFLGPRGAVSSLPPQLLPPHYTMPAMPRPVLIAHATVASRDVQTCMPQPPLALYRFMGSPPGVV